MLLLQRTTDAALAQAAVDALLNRGVEAYATGGGGAPPAWYAQGPPEYCIFLTSATDADRARRILLRLGGVRAAPTAAARLRRPRWVVWTVVLLVLALACFVAVHFNDGSP